MSDLQPPLFVVPQPPRKPFFRPLAKRLFGTRKKQLIAGAVLLALVGGIAGASAVSSKAAADHRVAVAFAHKKAEANAIAEAKAAAVRQAEAALEDAKAAAGDAYTKSVAAATAAASFAEVPALAAVKTAQDALTALYNGNRPATTDELLSATSTLDAAVFALGTASDATDRAYLASETAAGRSFTNGTSIIRIARDYCKSLDSYYAADPLKAIDRFLDHQDSEDVIAVTAYCPQYLPGIVAVAAMIPADGGYAVGAGATPYGVSPQVIAAGSYSTRGAVTNCYWEVNDSHGGILRNNFILSAPGGVTVQVRAGQGFTTQGCGAWTHGTPTPTEP
jgi:hypothetical protein